MLFFIRYARFSCFDVSMVSAIFYLLGMLVGAEIVWSYVKRNRSKP